MPNVEGRGKGSGSNKSRFGVRVNGGFSSLGERLSGSEVVR